MRNTLFFEAMPYGNTGEVASTLIDQLTKNLKEGHPVYVDHKYPGLEQVFRLIPASGNLHKVSLQK
jgi:hypothetical protein